VTRILLLGLIATVFMVTGMSAEAKLSDDSSGLRLADNEPSQSRLAELGYIWSDEIRSDPTAPLSTLAADLLDEQVDSYYASDTLVTAAAMGLAVIVLSGFGLVGRARRRHETLQAGRTERWGAELIEFSNATSPISPAWCTESRASPSVGGAVHE
jgi:hypothetical protein